MATLKALADRTYRLEHNPNCSSAYLLRFVGPGKGMLDGLPVGRTKDVLVYGTTLSGAVDKALRRLRRLEVERVKARQRQQAAHERESIRRQEALRRRRLQPQLL